nr:hypothetical protein [Mesorhizobium sp.]
MTVAPYAMATTEKSQNGGAEGGYNHHRSRRCSAADAIRDDATGN